MIVLFTDFGLPYTAQMEAVLHGDAPGARVVTLFNDAPAHNPMAAAYLLAAYATEFPRGSVFLCVVDPGVGGDRPAGVLGAGGHWYVGPDNGLFELVARRAGDLPRWWQITWRPERLSASFHGRDVFAPVAARLARGETPDGGGTPWGREGDAGTMRRADWPDDLAEVVYIDGFGNVMTGMRAGTVADSAIIVAGNQRIGHARTFSEVSPGQAFWYENANGLLEIAVNRGRAESALGLAIGAEIMVEKV